MKDITPRILQQQWGHDAWKQNGQDGHEVNVRGDEKIAAGAPKDGGILQLQHGAGNAEKAYGYDVREMQLSWMRRLAFLARDNCSTHEIKVSPATGIK